MENLTMTCEQQRRLPNWYEKTSGDVGGATKDYCYETQKRHRRLGQHYWHRVQSRFFQHAIQAAFIRVLESHRAVNICHPVEVDAGLENRFRMLVARWREETRSVSSTTDRALHPAYQDIIGMGKPVLRLLFRELEQNGGHWFWALRHITRENPVPQQDAGNINRMREAWLRWGREHLYL
jgi:hypothetical protein